VNGEALPVSSFPFHAPGMIFMKRLSAKLTYANVISMLCFILLVGGGTAFAATALLPKSSVGASN
jgi:hypothetical protein